MAFKFERVDSKIRQMVDVIVRRFHPDKVILFGSRARGTARPDSDADLLVVMEVRGSRRKAAIAIRGAIGDIDLAKDVIVVTPEEVANERNLIGTLIHPALREGKVLYAK